MAFSAQETLVDRFGRTVDYIRISVTDRCDFRCVYCMEPDTRFVPHNEVLTLEELAFVARAFTELGVKKIRLTGGEPLVRRNVVKLMEDIATLPGLRELVLTTNGSQLERLAGAIKAAGVKRINISLDSLDPERFARITRTGQLAPVLAGIEAARAAGWVDAQHAFADDGARTLRGVVWFDASLVGASLLAVIVGVLGVMNTMLMTVFERKQEICILLAIGWKRARIIRMVLWESALLGLLGGIIGVIFGTAGVKLMEQLPSIRGMLEPDLSFGLMAVSVAIAIAVGVISGLYPAWRSSRLTPSFAMQG
jgi:cell division protein FtsX